MDTINLVFKLVNNFKILFRNRWCDGIPWKAMVFPGMRQAVSTLYRVRLFQQVRSDSCRHLLLTGMSRFLMSKPKQQDQPTVQLDL